MRLKPQEREQFCSALESAFDTDTLRQMLFLKLGISLYSITSKYDNTRRQICDVAEWAERNDKVNVLLDGAQQYNPTNLDLMEFAENYNSQTVSRASRSLQPVNVGGIVVGQAHYDDVCRAFGPSQDEGYDPTHTSYSIRYPRLGIEFVLDMQPDANQEVCRIVLNEPYAENLLGCLTVGMPETLVPSTNVGAYKRQMSRPNTPYALYKLGDHDESPHRLLILFRRGKVTEIHIEFMREI